MIGSPKREVDRTIQGIPEPFTATQSMFFLPASKEVQIGLQTFKARRQGASGFEKCIFVLFVAGPWIIEYLWSIMHSPGFSVLKVALIRKPVP